MAMQNDSGGIYSPSDDTEGPVLRDFVDETIAHENEPISMPSPRTELLSSTSNLANESHNDRSSRSRRGPTERYRRERESVYRHTSHNDLLRILIEKEYTASKMQKTLYMAFAQLEGETQRANEARKQVEETLSRVSALNQRTLNAEAETRTLREELNLYRIHYEMAQNQITKAQTVLATLRSQKENAETVARKARGDARKVKEALGVWKAREEGRKQGFEAGWRRAREEFGLSTGQPILPLNYIKPGERQLIQPETASSETDEDDYEDDISYTASDSHADDLRLPHEPVEPIYTASSTGPPAPENIAASSSGHPISTSHYVEPGRAPSSVLVPEYIQQHQMPPPRTPSAVGTRTPAMERFSIDIPPADSVVVNQNINPMQPTRSNSFKKFVPVPWRPGAHRERPSSPHPPDNYIPEVSEDGLIPLPPPHEMGDYFPTPRSQITDLPHHTRSVSLDGSFGGGNSGGGRPASASGGRRGFESAYGDLDREGPSTSRLPNDETVGGPSDLQTPASWYQNKPTSRPSSVRSRDFAYSESGHRPHASVDSNLTGSSNLSHIDIIRGREEPLTSEPKQGGAITNVFRALKGKGKGKARQLSVINENPLSRQGSLNVHSQVHAVLTPSSTQNVQSGDSLQTRASPSTQQADSFSHDSRYAAPTGPGRANQWQSPRPIEVRHDRPPRNVRLPAQLTVPAPLSPQTQRVANTSIPERARMQTMSSGSMSSGFYQGSLNQPRGSRSFAQTMQRPASVGSRRTGNSMTGSPPVGINVEPPSQSPSEHPGRVPSGISHKSFSADPHYDTIFRADAPTSPRPSLSNKYSNPLPDDWVPTVPNTPESAPLTWPAARSPDRRSYVDPYDRPGRSQRPKSPSVNVNTSRSEIPNNSRGGGPNGPSNSGIGGAPYSAADANGSNASIVGGTLRRVPSNLSTRSRGSYKHFDPETYQDPALFLSGDSSARPPSRPRSLSRTSAQPPSGLEYI
ncbi:hypothetical protein E1B28_003916 [Marasmius oreades]|uniref:Uncharacterized protein n=1 Tax=Marasmius oreades TaxID=181124 RepID=A0A9P7UXH6_9AGAR|nr:uncharacterized protein E1B28_003916 [Marasmius oreades]KAG7096486.1 hypothetical protein E1B28_003916 [Marasmius oreades]